MDPKPELHRRIDVTSPAQHAFIRERAFIGFGPLAGALLFLTLTGIVVWLWPFGVFSQMAVLIHTALGVLLVVPLALWQLSHWLAARKLSRSFRKMAAYVGLWLLATTTVAGGVLAWQAMLSLHIGRNWDRIHLWVGLLLLPPLAYHVWPRAKRTDTNGESAGFPLEPDDSPARRRMWKVAGGTTIALLAALGAATLWYRLAYRSLGAGGYQFSSDYQWTYGQNPFAPSLATTDDGKPVRPEVLASSSSCGSAGCHTAIYREWSASAHRWAAEDKFFQAVQGAMIKEAGAPATRYCGGCHDPVSLLSGYKDASTGISAPGFKEGDSCVVCHATRRVDVQGNGNYVLGSPKRYLFEYETGRYRSAIARFLIRAYPRQHDRDYDLTLAERPESCASCHKQFIDKEINHVGWVQLQNQYDDWKHGKWNSDRDPARRLRCQQCHMYYEGASGEAPADPYDLKVGLGLEHRNHYFAAANQAMPAMISSPDAVGQARRAEEWLKGERVIPEIADIWPRGPVLPIKISLLSPARAGADLQIRVVVSNDKAGHSFPTGPLDLIRAWVDVVVRDQTERVLFHSGALTAENHIEPGTFVLKAAGVNSAGEDIVRHDLWHYVGAKFKRTIFPGYSDMYEYRLTVPEEARGPLEVAARLRYRKANQYFMDWAYPGQHLTTPITDISSARVEIPLVVGDGSGRTVRRPGRGRAALTRPHRDR